jgi:hypothetical protein
LLRVGALPRWQMTLFLIGVLLVGTPDGMEIINLSASVLMAIALIPYGIQVMTGQTNADLASLAPRFVRSER